MKTTLILMVCSMGNLTGSSANWTEDSRRIEAEQVALWEGKLVEVQSKPPEARSADLWLGLRNMGHRTTYDGHSPAVDAIYQKIQRELISIPGHAQYFADEIERERATLKPKDYRGGYDDHRRLAFETLAHLPSPETIEVLGHYLSDDRDAAKEANWDSHGILWGMAPNSLHAVNALKTIGLRDLGFVEPSPGNYPDSGEYPTREDAKRARFDYHVAKREEQRKPWLAWWEEVKSGERTFSFKGQAVEYRFNPDGTWETLAMAHPPDDGPRPTKPVNAAVERPEKRQIPATPPEEQQDARKPWAWILCSIVALLIVVVCTVKRSPERT